MSKTPTGRAKTKKTVATAKSRGVKAANASSRPSQKHLQLPNLQRWHVWLAIVFGAQAVAILLLSVVHKLPISLHYLAPDPLSPDARLVPANHQLFEINLVQLVAAFLLIATVMHVLALTVYRSAYEKDLSQGVSLLSWLESTLTTSTMVIVLALLGGVYDLASLLMIFALMVFGHGLHLFMNLRSSKRSNDKVLGRFACVAALVPWIVLALYIFGTHTYGLSQLPVFVYWLYASMAILFSAAALNRYFQYTKRGRWADYLYGEKGYLVLSLITKTALAWQVFAGVLRA